MRHPCPVFASRLVALAVTIGGPLAGVGMGQEPPPSQPTRQQSLASMTTKLDQAAKAREKAATLESRIRETTWRLLVGEAASDKGLALSSGATDALSRGLAELDQLIAELDQDVELQRELSTQPQLALRFDAAVVRRGEAAALKELTRADELARLSQLRELNRAYRALLQHLLAAQIEQLLGQPAEFARQGKNATDQLARAEEIVGQRRDFYLFEDEPALQGNSSELKLIQELAAPYAADVRRHQQSLLSVATCRLALQADVPDQKLLESALALAESAQVGLESPDAVALYAQGLASLELGRLRTVEKPFQEESHREAEPLFRSAKDSLLRAQKAIPADTKLTSFRVDLDRLAAEIESPEAFLTRALELEQRGDFEGASQALQRGATLHRSRGLALRWIESQWRAETLDEPTLDRLLSQLTASGIVTPDDAELLTLRGRILISNAWRTLGAPDEAQPDDARTDGLLKRIDAGLASLRQLKPADESVRWSNEAYMALGEAMAVLLSPLRDGTDGSKALERIPLVVAELERLMAGQALPAQRSYWESVHLARIAEGYLALRLDPDYRDRSRLAFAAAADAAAKLPSGAIRLRPMGSAILAAIVARDESANLRLAQEERQLRQSLQKMLPALAAQPLGEPQAVADSLVTAHRAARSASPSWDPKAQLNPRDTHGAREGLVQDSRAVTAISLVSAGKPEAALQELVGDLWPDIKDTDPAKWDWNLLRDRSAELADPLSLYALALATEEYAVKAFPSDEAHRSPLLKNALSMFERTGAILKETSAWRTQWPYLSGLAAAGTARLTNENFAVSKAKTLRNNLQLSEARSVLEKARLRHPQSIELRQELVRAMIDEAQMVPAEQQTLLTRALAELESEGFVPSESPTSTLLMLADLRERLGQESKAAEAYQEVASRTNDQAERLKAQSRLVVLQVRSQD